MKKLLSLFALLMTIVIGAKAEATPDYESYDWSEDDATAVIGTHGDITISKAGLGNNGNVSGGHYYIPVNQNLKSSDSEWKYFGISATRQITQIDVLYCENGTSTTATNIAWIAWGKNVTPAQVSLAHGMTDGTTGGKNWDNKKWVSIDLSGTDAYTVYLSRSIREFKDSEETTISNFGAGQTFNILGLRVYLKAAGPEITAQPVSAAYVTGDAATAMHVGATASAGELSYQWYRCDDTDKTNASAISGSYAQVPSYTPSTANSGTYYYFCRVTDANGSTDSNVATINVSDASAPTINVTGAPAGEIVTGTDVTLTAIVTGVPTPSIKWFSNTTASKTGATVIPGETSETFSPSTATPGTYYYFAQAINSQGDNSSDIQTIVVKDKVATPTFTPNGAYFEEAQTITISCTTEGAAIQYSTDGGNTWNNYEESIKVYVTTTVQAKATKDGCIDSEVASATFTQFNKSVLVPISTAKTWTFPTSLSLQLKTDGSTTPAKYDEYYTYADIATINGNNLGEFDGTTLAFSGEYPYRGSNGSQNGNLQFITTVPGIVSVEFSNTGGSNNERWVKVNGTRGSVEASGTTHRTENFNVSAGSVTITHVGKDGNLSNGLRMYTVTFTPSSTENITIPEGGVATYVTQNALDFSTQNGAFKAYTVTGKSENFVTTNEVTQVPAGTVLLLKGAAASYNVDIVESAEAVDNLLQASDGTVTGADNIFAYSKSNGKFVKVASTVSIPAGKAYLVINAPNTDSFDIDFGDATAVDAIAEANEANNEAPVKIVKNGQLFIGNFNVAGQQVK